MGWIYDISDYYKGRDKSIEYYELLFGDCPDPIRADMKEVMAILEDRLMYLHGPTVDRAVATNRI